MYDLSKVESSKNYSPLIPGANIPVIMEKLEVSPEGHLDFFFRGTSKDNPGVFKPRYWANNFDPSDGGYKADKAENLLKQIKQIIDAYIPAEKQGDIKGATWLEFAGSVKAALTPNLFDKVETNLQVIYQRGSDVKLAFPLYRPFISTDLVPQALVLNAKTDENGIPFDRVLPLSEYNVKGTTGSPSEEEDIPFSFGDDTLDEVAETPEEEPFK